MWVGRRLDHGVGDFALSHDANVTFGRYSQRYSSRGPG